MADLTLVIGNKNYSVANSNPYILKELIVLPVVIVLPNISLMLNLAWQVQS